MATIKNNKSLPKKKKPSASSRFSEVKTFIISVALGGLSAIGFTQCWDENTDGFAEVDSPKERSKSKETESIENDPTLINENQLLLQERPKVQSGKGTATVRPSIADPALVVKDPNATLAEAARFPMYAVAFQFHTQVRNAPRMDAPIVGYARRGATFRVSQEVSTKGCKKGWHEIAPGGYFVCEGQGTMIADRPVSFTPSPPAPEMNAPMPYQYAYITRPNTPQYWRIPSTEESAEVATLFDKIALREAAGQTDAGIKPTAKPEARVASKEEENTDTANDAGTANPYALPSYVHQRLQKGYYVSLDARDAGSATSYATTIRDRYIPADTLTPASPSDQEGILVTESNPLPRVMVVGSGVKRLAPSPSGDFASTDTVERYASFPLLGEIVKKGKRYVEVAENRYFSEKVVTVLRGGATPPPELQPGERWVDIDLSDQSLVAYEGTTPVFATIIASGRSGFETPEGTFSIYAKHVTITMDDPDGGEEAYSIEDVPWTQYFNGSYALHAAFWHDKFGRVRSHGCINLSPKDAKRLFFWTGPHLADGFHGVMSTDANPGTRVVVHQ